MTEPPADRTHERRVLFLEPWLGGSHRVLTDAWTSRSRHQVQVEGLAPRHWRWRQEASGWELARLVAKTSPPDVLVVSDFVDLPRLLGFLPAEWAGVSTIVYFHENQLTYRPTDARAAVPEDAHAAFANVLTAVRADEVVINSIFHRDDLAAAGDRYLRTLPRPSPRAEFAAAMEAAHVVAPAPDLETVPPGPGGPDDETLRVLFPHRLEEDKDPMAFARAVRAADQRGARIEVVLTGGEPERARGEALDALALLEPHLVSAGMRARGEYLELIGTCDVVASTARHEFFGIAVAEAMAAGCAPLLPDRLNYPALVEGLPAAERARALFSGEEHLADELVRRAGAPLPDRDPAPRANRRAAVLHLDAARCVEALDRIVDEA